MARFYIPIAAGEGNVGPTGPAGLEGSSYIFVAGDGTAAENGTALQAAYTAAKALTPYGNALADDNRAWVIVAPGTYDTTLVMDEEFVNVVSLDGDMSIRLTGIDVQADNVLVRGIDVGTSNFLIGDDLAGLVAEKCRGGDNSFGGFSIASGTFTNCTGGYTSFGGSGTASGTFINCTGDDVSFGGFSIASGTFIDCEAGWSSFGGGGTASGTFTNCTGGDLSFGFFGTASGTFTNCTGGYVSFGGFGGTASGTFTNCTGGELSFGSPDPEPWEIGFINGEPEPALGLTGQVLYCRLTDGTFPTPTSGGIIRLSLDGNFTEVNEG